MATRVAPGTYTVTRVCCRSGQCFDCHQRGSGPARVVHAADVDAAMARKMLAGWRDYAPEVSPALPKD